MKQLDYKDIEEHIVSWLKEYADNSGVNGFVIGVSGGIDSAVASTLCAKTGYPVLCLEMPIHQNKDHITRAKEHISWLKNEFGETISPQYVDLSSSYDSIVRDLENVSILNSVDTETKFLTLANTRSRLRMLALYANANLSGCLVCGTGNKVEDFGIGFFTKGGDGVVDISPIADLLKSEVYKLGANIGICDSILNAEPTDGLWDDERTDESQVGASYDELELAMENSEKISKGEAVNMSKREKEVLDIYIERHTNNKHKMEPIPVCSIEKFREKLEFTH